MQLTDSSSDWTAALRYIRARSARLEPYNHKFLRIIIVRRFGVAFVHCVVGAVLSPPSDLDPVPVASAVLDGVPDGVPARGRRGHRGDRRRRILHRGSLDSGRERGIGRNPDK